MPVILFRTVGNINNTQETMMSVYTLRNLYKKHAREIETWMKVEPGSTEGKIVIVDTGWRWASFTVTTDDGEKPDLDLDNFGTVNPYYLGGEGNIEDVEMESCEDGVHFELYSDDLTEEELDELREEIEESSHLDVLEAAGYINEDTEFSLEGPLVILDEDDEEIARGAE